MAVVVGVVGALCILIILWDAFETIVLPRRVTGRLRLTRMFFRLAWPPWAAIACRMRPGPRRESYLGFFGPLSLILLLIVWASGLILGFAMIQWALGSPLIAAHGRVGFGTDIYESGTTFFTLGLGDVAPRTAVSRALTVIEVGTGFGILALVISYLPVLYSAFSQREVTVSLLDARGGSPPTAVELLRRHGQSENARVVGEFLREWERWAAQLMEGHLSYPVLAYFRSQHENQSWLSALTVLLDICALALAGAQFDGTGGIGRPARLAFATARHAAVDLSHVLAAPPRPPAADRLPPDELARVREALSQADVAMPDNPEVTDKLIRLRSMYEPYVWALSQRLLLPLPPFMPAGSPLEYWRTGAWEL